jgi:Fe2+ transport system protein FeoA
MKTEDFAHFREADPGCAHPLCPLNRVKAGVAVRIKQLCATPELSERLREIGFCEDRIIRLLTSHSNIICRVCNARLALSEQLAKTILVEPVGERAAI